MADLDAIRDGLEKDRVTAVIPPRPKDVQIITDLIAEVERLRRSRKRLSKGLASSAAEVDRLRDGIRVLTEPPTILRDDDATLVADWFVTKAEALLDDREESHDEG